MGNKIDISNKRFADLMIENEKTDKEVAEYCGCTKRYINQMFNGERPVTKEYIIKFAEYFNVSTDYLLGLTDIETPDEDKKFVCEYTGLDEKTIDYLSKAKTDTFNYWIIGFFDTLVNKISENERIIAEMIGLTEYTTMYIDTAETIIDLYVNKENAKICDNFTAKNPKYYSIADPDERKTKIEMLLEKFDDISLFLNGTKYAFSNFCNGVIDDFSVQGFIDGSNYEYIKQLGKMVTRCQRDDIITVDEYNEMIKNQK